MSPRSRSPIVSLVGWLLCLATLLGVVLGLVALVPYLQRSHKTRPYGYLRLGPVKSFVPPFVVIPGAQVIVFRDEKGLSAMSTMCTHDLSPLRLVDRAAADVVSQDQGDTAQSVPLSESRRPAQLSETTSSAERFFLASDLSSSRYALDGHVLSGPAIVALPYYRLVIDTSQPVSQDSQVFAYVGEEVDNSWRLLPPSDGLFEKRRDKGSTLSNSSFSEEPLASSLSDR